MNDSGPKHGNILERIRERPPMFLGTRTITGLWHFLYGYNFARHELGAEPSYLLPEDFHDWTAYRLHFRESTSGWRNMIFSRVPDEGEALERFFELLDEHRDRQMLVVATVRRHPQDHKVRRSVKVPGGEESPYVEVPCAEEISIGVFTGDPGSSL